MTDENRIVAGMDAFKPGTRFAVFCDLDGTLCNNDHRRHFVERAGKKDWPAFFAGIPGDDLVLPVANVFHALQNSGMIGLLLTGRYEKHRGITEAWLKRFSIAYERLVMRPDGDNRSDEIVKFEMLEALRSEGIEPRVVIDDRDRVVAMWRAEGLTCLQAAPGAF